VISFAPFQHHMIGQACSFTSLKINASSLHHGSHSHTTDLRLIIPVLMAVIPEALIVEVCVDSLQSAITLVMFSGVASHQYRITESAFIKGQSRPAPIGWKYVQI